MSLSSAVDVNPRKSVMVVDDDEVVFHLINGTMGAHFELTHCASGDDCLREVAVEAPDVILLDVNMPGMDGYQTCEQLKADPASADIPVLFLSAADTLDERLRGYAVGGDDYVVKPVTPKELREKLRVIIERRERVQQLQSEVSSVADTAMAALTASGEQGSVIHFMREAAACADMECLLDALLKTLTEQQLECCVQLRSDNAILTKSTRGTYRPLEEQLMMHLSEEGRIVDFDRRTVINFPMMSVLITNMPLEDEAAYGRIKDTVTLLLEGAQARLGAISAEQEVIWKTEILERTAKFTQQGLDELRESQRRHNEISMGIVDDLSTRVSEAFATLGLNESQEEELWRMTQESVERALAVYEERLDADATMDRIVSMLNAAVDDKARR